MDCWKIDNKGFTLVELMVATSLLGLLSLVGMRLISDKNKHSTSAIVRTRELTDLISNLRFLKRDIEYAHEILRKDTTKLTIKLNQINNIGDLEEIEIEYKIISTCNLGRAEKIKNDPSGSKTQYNTSLVAIGNFSCLLRTTIKGGVEVKKIKLTGIKDFKWCITNGDCINFPLTDIKIPDLSFPDSSPNMIKLQIYDYKGQLQKMLLGLTNIGFLNLARKDIMFID